MAVFTKIIHEYKLNQIRSLVQLDLLMYYVGLARYTPWSGGDIIPDATNYSDEEITTSKREMIFGQRLFVDDIMPVFTRKTWAANTVYDMYDHRHDLRDSDFYVINASGQTYKCLFNNYGSPSTVEPTSTSTLPFEIVEDGYIWKYLFTISQTEENRYGTVNYAPINFNANTIASAANGAIHVVMIDGAGTNYTQSNGMIQQVVSNNVFKVEATASASNGFYTNSSIYIPSGTGAGNVAVISNYFVNAIGKYVTTSTPLSLDLTSHYVIAPQVEIIGDGSGAKAYCAEVNQLTGAVEKIEVVDPGADYSFADVAIHSFSGANAQARAIISPRGGHGKNLVSELLSEILCFSSRFASTGNDTLATDVTFRSAVLCVNPLAYDGMAVYEGNTYNALYAFDLSSATDVFEIGETVIGTSSQASGTVASSNTTHCRLGSVSGTFVEDDVLVGTRSVSTAVIESINTPDILPLSGEIFAIEHLEPTTRADNRAIGFKVLVSY